MKVIFLPSYLHFYESAIILYLVLYLESVWVFVLCRMRKVLCGMDTAEVRVRVRIRFRVNHNPMVLLASIPYITFRTAEFHTLKTPCHFCVLVE